jgi:hypothetical protein
VDELSTLCGENDADIADAYAALALVEAALDAAESTEGRIRAARLRVVECLPASVELSGVLHWLAQVETANESLAAALRAVREGK